SITLPSGASSTNQYAFDGESGLTTHQAMTNTITQKALTYNQEYDGSSTPITETTSYSINDTDGTGTATITNPDGGVVAETHSISRTTSVHQPDGSLVERIWK